MSIFINIASYNDPDLEKTLIGALDNADNPDSLFFAIAIQNKEDLISDISFIPKNQTKVLRWNMDKRPGTVKVRNILDSFYDNQDYYLMLDSHMIFAKHWDTKIIAKLNAAKIVAGHNKVIISNAMHHKDPPIDSVIISRSLIVNSASSGFIDFRVQKELELNELTDFNNGVYNTNILTCNNVFADGNFVIESGTDPYSHYFQEEPYMSFKAFMLGWDIYGCLDHPIEHTPHNYYKYNTFPGDVNPTTRQTDIKQIFETRATFAKDSFINEFYRTMTYIYNDPNSRFSIPNAVRNPKDFWECFGLEEKYEMWKDYYDKMLNIDSGEFTIDE